MCSLGTTLNLNLITVSYIKALTRLWRGVMDSVSSEAMYMLSAFRLYFVLCLRDVPVSVMCTHAAMHTMAVPD